MNSFRTYGAILAAVAFWGASFVWVKIVFNHYGPISMIFLRLVIASAALLPFALARRERIDRKHWRLFAALAFCEPLLYFLCESAGLMRVSATIGSLVIGTIPVFTTLLAPFLLKERTTPLALIGMVLSVAGIGLVVFDPHAGMEFTWPGLALMFGAVFSAVFHNAVMRRLVDHYSPITIVRFQNLLGALYFLPLFVIFEAKKTFATSLTAELVWAMLALSIFASTFSFLFYSYAMKRLGAVRTNMFVNFIPLFTAGFAWWLLDEGFGFGKILGMAVVMGGVALSQVTLPSRKVAANV